MKIKLRTWLSVLLGIIALIVLVVVGGVAYLRGSGGSTRILAFAQKTLADSFNTKLEYAEGSLDVFKGLHFKNLKIVRDQDGQKAEITIDALDVDYSFSIWNRSVDIARVEIQHPVIKVVSTKSEPETPEEEDGAGLKKLEELIQDPPVRVTLHKFVLNDLDLDFEQRVQPNATEAHIRGLDLAARFEMVKNRLLVSGEFNSGEPARVVQSTTKDGIKQSLALEASASGKWDLKIQKESEKWVYEMTPSNFKAVARKIVQDQSGAGSTSHLELPEANFSTDIKFLAKTQALFRPDPNTFESLEAKGNLTTGRMGLVSRSGLSPESRIDLGAQSLQFAARLSEGIEADLTYHADRVAMPEQFLKPVALDWSTKVHVTRDLKEIKTSNRASLEAFELLNANVNLKMPAEEAQPIAFDGTFKVTAEPSLARVVKSAAQLTKTGAVDSSGDFQGTWAAKDAKLSLGSDLKLNNKMYGSWLAKINLALAKNVSGEGTVDLTNVTQPDPKAIPVALTQPVHLEHRFDLTAGRQSVDVTVNAPAITHPEFGKFTGTKLKLKATSPDFAKADSLDGEASVTQTGLALNKELVKGVSQLAGLDIKAKGNIRQGRNFTLESLKADLDKSSVQVSAQATGDIKAKTALLNAQLTTRFTDRFSPLDGQDVRGTVEIPIQVSVLRGQEFNVSGSIDTKNLSWKKGAIAASGISGRLPFSEKLNWDGKNFRFTHLITQNPFERVDFERVRPLLQGTEQMRIEKIKWEEKSYGPFLGFFSLKQNVVFVHQFDLDIGSGRAYGQMFFDAYPSNMQFGLLSRLTGLNMQEILPAKYLKRVPKDDKNLSGRTGFVINLNRSTMDGRFDITEIGGAQLIAMINVLDPMYEDEKMNKVRSLLQLGYPTSVGMAFADGYMNMDIAVSVLGLSQRQSLYGIPISSLLSSATADIVKQTEKGPLK